MTKILVTVASMWPREVCDIKPKATGKGKTRLFVRTGLGHPGVYVLYRDDQPYYIGQAKNLGARIWTHANHPGDRYYNFWNFFSAFVVSNESYLDEVEGILISAMPTANSSTPRIKRIVLPSYVTHQLRIIRRHQADPLTHQEVDKIVQKRLTMRSVR